VILGIRPADLEDAEVWTGQDLPTIDVVADVAEELGSEVNVLFTIDAPPVETDETLAATEGEDTDLFHDEQPRATFCAQVDARSKAAAGRTVRLAVDASRFHFFDPDTGLALARSAT
jgi:multiple sugar transport system ATP-binding protein